ncbi:RagB/SusD family nutrient uptake outer membrane protein [Massilibacteroides vaginae]|uniref:RagB/SusD family nutrient uptake outer membrane protein n=1 Tax=Massilibacteroides vaginae TaxID=1673718 RepID=UPI000A1C9037|nr:RagB/SusD family nutrient uptake outer membrane protein [Massilibacteroides vaginae]
MKKNIIALLVAISIGLTSCDGFLEENPKGLISDSYAKTEEGAEALVLSMYQRNRYLVERMVKFADCGTDLTTFATNGVGWPYEEAMLYNDPLLISNRFNSQYWKYLYRALNVANASIHFVQEATMSNEEKRIKLASEAHAMRAFYLFMIVETWGPASHYSETPSQTVITEGYQPGIAAFYERIFKDIEVAEKSIGLPQDTKFGRMNIGVVKMLKMRVMMSFAAYDDTILSQLGYTKQKCYEEAIVLSNSIVNDYNYKLLDNYSSIFDVNNQINSEIIWSIQYSSDLIYNGMETNEDSNHLHRYFVGWYNKSAKNTNQNIDGLWSHSRVYGREYRCIMPTYYYLTCFNKFDKRREQTFQTAWCRIPENWNNEPIYTDTLLIRPLDVVSPDYVQDYNRKGVIVDEISDLFDLKTGVPTINGRSCHHTLTKYLDPSRDEAKREEGFKDLILMRLGEVYITLSEAYVRTGQLEKAAETITKLRERALITGHEQELKITASDMTMEFILEEGARELGGELNRWYMLKRSGMLVKWVKEKNPDISLIKDYHIYRPIPQDALYEVTNLDVFKQNEGYN